MKEQDIIALLQKKSEDGLTALSTHYEPLMRYIIAPILHNPQDQEDCLAEVTMRVWNNIDQYNPKKGSWKSHHQKHGIKPRSCACAPQQYRRSSRKSPVIGTNARGKNFAAGAAKSPRGSIEPAFLPRSSLVL